ncbi:ABC-2 type transporter-domain-containing protein [Microdochium bolleyi]|uniref:ABC-2 type transporter-domain-containing protein n=1 Tax=Microdochium bolleyi TaxID=196109 RepID=A0A136JGI6_9PEZI|nr:ABC-2 type transporter-domain-containing protein [Microdochium bolleyi]
MSGSSFDPSDPNFDFERWTRNIMNLRTEMGIPTPPRSGVLFKDLSVHGYGQLNKQRRTARGPMSNMLQQFHRRKETKSLPIIQGFIGVLEKGELLLVLGRPGSGCSTFLKAIVGKLDGLQLGGGSTLLYSGIPVDIMINQFRGELVYSQELDEHFPFLTVRQTLEFAAAARTPRLRLPGVSRSDRIKHLVDVVMTVFGIKHTDNTIVGNDYVRGVSGGERKRVSIAEIALLGAAVSSWDNPTRGLDADTSLKYVRSLAILSQLTQSSNAVALSQASQAIYNLFDKVLVLYEGREIFFGRGADAAKYFEKMGWRRHARQTTADFVVGVTSPAHRATRDGFEERIPRTAEDFEKYWRESPYFVELMTEIEALHGEARNRADQSLAEFQESRKLQKMKAMRSRAPETISFPMQTWLCMRRSYQQLWNSKASTLTALIGQIVIALVVGSIFYGTPASTSAFFAYGSVLFFAVLLNALMAVTDIHNLYQHRPIIQKHVSFSLYRPSADALARILIDIPVKLVVATCFNLFLYFLSGLAATPAQFFIFFLFVFVSTLVMSLVFKTVATVTSTLAQAMAISGFLILALVIYTGFVLPSQYMHPWFKWFSYINPLAYAFEALSVNQAHGVYYPCDSFIPSYPGQTGQTFICPIPGAVAGETYVLGDAWFEASYGYAYSHLWHNLGILLGFLVFFLALHLLAMDLKLGATTPAKSLKSHSDLVSDPSSDRVGKGKSRQDPEAPTLVGSQADVSFHPSRSANAFLLTEPRPKLAWKGISYTITIKGEPRKLLDNVSGWADTGTITALMGISGAGKTTLLDAVAQRLRGGVSSGELFLDGKPISASASGTFGYVQQQDIHLETSTVREALQFSACLRQRESTSAQSGQQNYTVEDVIRLLGMEVFSDNIVGRPGNGLSGVQRKLLSIGVELVANPRLLLLDEPTSGLDSQSALSIVALLRRLADNGLAVICTIHQPSAMLFRDFDRLLLLTRGGRTVYFGDIGEDARTLVQYFQSHKARMCHMAENPAEYVLEVIGSSGSQNQTEAKRWPHVWKESPQAMEVSDELARRINVAQNRQPERIQADSQHGRHSSMVSLWTQMSQLCLRLTRHYWRCPAYIRSKVALSTLGSLLIGFSFFQPKSSILGVQTAIFAVILFSSILSSLAQQIMPQFLLQRNLYEGRERYSRLYSWAAFILVNILIEIPLHIVIGITSFAIVNYTVFGIRSAEEQGLTLLFFVYFFIFTGTFAHMLIASLPDTVTASRIATILFSMMVLFAGVFQPPAALPDFWIFMYYISPITYFVRGVAVAGLWDNPVECSISELAVFQPPAGLTCGIYLEAYLAGGALGTLLNPGATSNCTYCPVSSTNQVLARSNMYDVQVWANWLIGFAYISFNISCTFGLYYLFRVHQWGKWVAKAHGLVRRRDGTVTI